MNKVIMTVFSVLFLSTVAVAGGKDRKSPEAHPSSPKQDRIKEAQIANRAKKTGETPASPARNRNK